MIEFFLAHWKLPAFIGTAFVALGLFLDEFTQPKVIAIVVYLSDWNMLWTWEWWGRTLFYLCVTIGAWFYQRRKHGIQTNALKAAWHTEVEALRAEIRHGEVVNRQLQTRIDILERHRR